MRLIAVPLRAVGIALALTAGVPLRGARPAPAQVQPAAADAKTIARAVDKRLRRQQRRAAA